MRIALLSCLLLVLVGCAATTPLVIGGLGVTEYAKFKADVRERAEACQASEQDLLPQSVKAISQGDAKHIIEVYLTIYRNPELPNNMKAESLYQIGLIYMNEYNEDRDDEQAVVYFNRLKTEFPSSVLCADVDERLAIINQRRDATVSFDADTLLAMRQAISERASSCYAEENALLPASIEAIAHKQAQKAINAYLSMVNDSKLSQAEREEALYQIALIYMNTQNVHRDDASAKHYFEQLLLKFPDSALCHDAKQHIATLEKRIEK